MHVCCSVREHGASSRRMVCCRAPLVNATSEPACLCVVCACCVHSWFQDRLDGCAIARLAQLGVRVREGWAPMPGWCVWGLAVLCCVQAVLPQLCPVTSFVALPVGVYEEADSRKNGRCAPAVLLTARHRACFGQLRSSVAGCSTCMLLYRLVTGLKDGACAVFGSFGIGVGKQGMALLPAPGSGICGGHFVAGVAE